MDFKYNYLFIHIYIFIEYILLKVYSYDLLINDDNDMNKIFNDINSITSVNELNLIFSNKTYKIPLTGSNNFQFQNTVRFQGVNNETIFDFQNKDGGSFDISPVHGISNSDKKIIFENITFYNFYERNYLCLFNMECTDDINILEFNNCTFINNKGISFFFKVSCTKLTHSQPQVMFNNCRFL